jgi:hypothetical protein
VVSGGGAWRFNIEGIVKGPITSEMSFGSAIIFKCKPSIIMKASWMLRKANTILASSSIMLKCEEQVFLNIRRDSEGVSTLYVLMSKELTYY